MKELRTGNSEIVTEALKEVKKEKKMTILVNTVTVPVNAEVVKNEKTNAYLENIDAGIGRMIELLEKIVEKQEATEATEATEEKKKK